MMSQNDQNRIEIRGVLDKSINPALKVWIKQGDRMVCGIIGPGTSRTLSAKWDSPLEQTNLGENTGTSMSGTAQAITGATSITTFSSTQIWQGNMPHKFSVNLILFAQYNAYQEVMLPLQWLEEFASPSLKDFSPIDFKAIYQRMLSWFKTGGKDAPPIAGQFPGLVTLNIGRRMIIPNCVIENISIPVDKEITQAGDLIRAEVQLDIQTITMVNKDKIPGMWRSPEARE